MDTDIPFFGKPSRSQVYEQFGRAMELAQLFETEVGTALLALDAIERKSFISPDPEAYKRLSTAIAAQTLGRSLAQMKERLHLTEDLEQEFASALKIRNHLAHRFFPDHGIRFLEESGQLEMLSRLKEACTTMQRAYTIAGNVAHALVKAVHQIRSHSSQLSAPDAI